MDYQSNSRKDREEREQKKEIPDKKIEKAIVGEAIRKPKGLGSKFKKTFFGGSAKQAFTYAITEVFIPEIQYITLDVIRNFAERIIFPDSQYRRRPRHTNYRASYQGSNDPITRVIDARGRPIPYPYPASPPSPPRGRVNRQDMDDVIVGTREEAEVIIERMNDVIEKYQVVSKADLYDIIGWETSHIDNKWGWEYIGNIPIRQVKQGYLLELPMLEEI